jgi:hypothetical protein
MCEQVVAKQTRSSSLGPSLYPFKSGHDSILEAGLGSTGAVLETELPEARRCRPSFGNWHLAQAQSNRGRRGRKRDFPDAERLVKRLVAHELVLSFVLDVE